MFDSNIKARLVCDGATLSIPPEMGVPSPDQMQGTLFERLSELCCRICYDSCGKGRASDKMHEHLLDVQHWSVYEHAHWTVALKETLWGDLSTYRALLNRPELRVVVKDNQVRITLNPRHLLDWDRWTKLSHMPHCATTQALFDLILGVSRPIAPNIFTRLKPYHDGVSGAAELVEPIFDSERFVTVFLSGGRGMSHEQVRHRFNISQRSTRYVDESGSPIIEHPLVSAFTENTRSRNNDNVLSGELMPAVLKSAIADLIEDWLKSKGMPGNVALGEACGAATHAMQFLETMGEPSLTKRKRKVAHKTCSDLYDGMVADLQDWLIARGVDKFTARKQARGAARNDLGNGLLTELMFTASVDMWDGMIGLRANVAADAEIRHMFTADAGVITALMESRYGQHFKDKWELVPSPDGLGKVAKAK